MPLSTPGSRDAGPITILVGPPMSGKTTRLDEVRASVEHVIDVPTTSAAMPRIAEVFELAERGDTLIVDDLSLATPNTIGQMSGLVLEASSRGVTVWVAVQYRKNLSPSWRKVSKVASTERLTQHKEAA